MLTTYLALVYLVGGEGQTPSPSSSDEPVIPILIYISNLHYSLPAPLSPKCVLLLPSPWSLFLSEPGCYSVTPLPDLFALWFLSSSGNSSSTCFMMFPILVSGPPGG